MNEAGEWQPMVFHPRPLRRFILNDVRHVDVADLVGQNPAEDPGRRVPNVVPAPENIQALIFYDAPEVNSPRSELMPRVPELFLEVEEEAALETSQYDQAIPDDRSEELRRARQRLDE